MMAKGCKASLRAVKYWMHGQTLPCVVAAFKIEAFSKGGIPIESWLDTTIGKAKWNGMMMGGKKHG